MTTLVSFKRIFEVLDLAPMVQDAVDAKTIDVPIIETKKENEDKEKILASANLQKAQKNSKATVEQALEQEKITVEPTIILSHVDFHYPSADEVSLASLESVQQLSAEINGNTLEDVSFTVPAGHLTALVGPSGAGKTTLSQLISRMYDVTGGSITIGGIDLREIKQQSIHDTIGVVTQDAHLFHDSLRMNLMFANQKATGEELEIALDRAQAHFAYDLPEGLDTVVGDRGYRLSG
jgi:ATP-binding cassette subfamily B protein